MFTEQTFQAEIVAVNYAEGPASGPAFVVLHGGSGRWQMAYALLVALTERYHVYAPDFRGHGRSSHVPGRYALRDYVADTAAFLRERVGKPAVLFGHSLGGQVAIMVAAHYPELVRALIIGDAPFSLALHRAELERSRARLSAWREIAAAGLSVEEIAARLRDAPVEVAGQEATVRTRDLLGEENPWFAFMAESLSTHDPSMLTAIIDAFDATHAGYDTDTLFPQITCPVLILQGRGELSDGEVERALAQLRHGKVTRFEHLGHELHTKDVSPVLAALEEFLAAIP